MPKTPRDLGQRAELLGTVAEAIIRGDTTNRTPAEMGLMDILVIAMTNGRKPAAAQVVGFQAFRHANLRRYTSNRANLNFLPCPDDLRSTTNLIARQVSQSSPQLNTDAPIRFPGVCFTPLPGTSSRFCGLKSCILD